MTRTMYRVRRRAILGVAILVALSIGTGALMLRPGSDRGPIIATIPIDRFPMLLAVDAQSERALLGSANSARLRLIDLKTGTIASSITLPQPLPFIWSQGAGNIDERTGRVYIQGQTYNGPASSSLSVLDMRSGRVVRTAPLPRSMSGLNVAPAIDLRARRIFLWRNTVVFPPASALYPRSRAPGLRSRRWRGAVPFPSGTPTMRVEVSVLDAITLRLLTTVSVSARPNLNTGWGMSGSPIAVDTRTGRVFAGDIESNSLGMLDARTGRLLRTIALRPARSGSGGTPQVPTPIVDESLGRVYVVDSANGIVHILDAATGHVVRDVPTGPFAGMPLISHRARRLYIFHNNGAVSVLDAVSGRLVRAAPPGSNPGASNYPYFGFGYSAASNERTGRVFIVNGQAGTVNVLDGTSGQLLRAVGVCQHPTGAAIDARSGRVYVACMGPFDPRRGPTGRGSVSVLDGRTGRVLRTIPVGVGPVVVSLDTRSQRALVVNTQGSGSPAPDAWGWLPVPLRRALPFLPRPASRPSPPSGSVTVIDTSRL